MEPVGNDPTSSGLQPDANPFQLQLQSTTKRAFNPTLEFCLGTETHSPKVVLILVGKLGVEPRKFTV